MSNTTQKNADKIRTRLCVAGYIARSSIDCIEVESTDVVEIGKIANAAAKCRVTVVRGKTLVVVG